MVKGALTSINKPEVSRGTKLRSAKKFTPYQRSRAKEFAEVKLGYDTPHVPPNGIVDFECAIDLL